MPAIAPERRLRLSDLYRLRTVLAVSLSPDGRTAVAVVEEHLRKADQKVTNLWRIDLDGDAPAHRLTSHLGQDRRPLWSPDGQRLAFLSNRAAPWTVDESSPPRDRKGPSDEKPRTQVWCLDLASGGEPVQLTRVDEGVDDMAWSPDGSRMVLSARAPTPEQARLLAAQRNGKAPSVIDRTQHKFDGDGFWDDVRSHLFVLDVSDGALRQITDGPCSEEHPAWSPDGRWIAFASNRTGDADNNCRTDLWVVSPEGTTVRRLTRGDIACDRPVWSPDSSRVAAVAHLEPENEYVLTHIAVVSVDDATPVADLAAFVGQGFSGIGGVVPDRPTGDPVLNARRYPVPVDQTPMRMPTRGLDRVMLGPIRWLDAEHLFTLGGDRGQTRLVGVDASEGSAQLLFPYDRGMNIEAFDLADGRAVMVIGTPEGGREVAWLPIADLAREDAEPRVRSAFFASITKDRTLAPYRRIAFRSTDGAEVEGLVALPPGFDPDHPAPMPLLVSIHGGPMAYDAPGFRFERQYWAAQGYLVLMVNYRGSISYGEAFCTAIRGDWGPREHADVMAGVDHLLSLGWTAPDRLFITGFSQGGIMTNWAIGHTDRFRAAVSEHGMWDYAAAFGTDDCHLWWQDDLGVPWQNAEGYRRISPSSAVENIHTPVLIMAGAEDWRCPVDQAELMYMALKKRGVDTRLVVYPGEHHAVTKPSRALDRLKRLGGWLMAHGGLPLVGDDAALDTDA